MTKLELLRGIPLFFVTVLPWYVAMFCRHGMPYYQRFFIHDHFNRVGAGVHQIDTGTFEYFVEWLGYGLWPWSAFAPLALLWALIKVRPDDDAPAGGSEPRPFVHLRFHGVDGALPVLLKDVDFVESVARGYVTVEGSPEYAAALNDFMQRIQDRKSTRLNSSH